MPATLLPDSDCGAMLWLKKHRQPGKQKLGAAILQEQLLMVCLPAYSNGPGHACVMNSGEMLRPSHMTKTRPQSIRYAPSGCTAAVVSGAGAGRTIPASARNCASDMVFCEGHLVGSGKVSSYRRTWQRPSSSV